MDFYQTVSGFLAKVESLCRGMRADWFPRLKVNDSAHVRACLCICAKTLDSEKWLQSEKFVWVKTETQKQRFLSKDKKHGISKL